MNYEPYEVLNGFFIPAIRGEKDGMPAYKLLSNRGFKGREQCQQECDRVNGGSIAAKINKGMASVPWLVEAYTKATMKADLPT